MSIDQDHLDRVAADYHADEAALAGRQPDPEPREPSTWDDASRMVFGADATEAERMVGLAYLQALAARGDRDTYPDHLGAPTAPSHDSKEITAMATIDSPILFIDPDDHRSSYDRTHDAIMESEAQEREARAEASAAERAAAHEGEMQRQRDEAAKTQASLDRLGEAMARQRERSARADRERGE